MPMDRTRDIIINITAVVEHAEDCEPPRELTKVITPVRSIEVTCSKCGPCNLTEAQVVGP